MAAHTKKNVSQMKTLCVRARALVSIVCAFTFQARELLNNLHVFIQARMLNDETKSS